MALEKNSTDKDKKKNTTEDNPSGKKYKLTSKLKDLYKFQYLVVKK